MKICIISDTHLHNWTQFSTINERGANSRLEIILNEMRRATKQAKAFGCDTLVHCGDLFHVKGKIDTSVLVPSIECLKEIRSQFDQAFFVTGNHDLAFANGEEYGNSMFISQCNADVITETYSQHKLGFIPWQRNIELWKREFQRLIKNPNVKYVFTHAPIDGVIKGLPTGGITQDYIESTGFKGKIFAGHYHNHKVVSEQLISVGALCHHTWSDVGSLSGCIFLDTVTDHWAWLEGETPKFVDLDQTARDYSAEEYAEICAGNYVRLTTDEDLKTAKEIHDELIETLGAKNALVNLKAKTAEVKRETTVKDIEHNPLSTSLMSYLDEKLKDSSTEFREEVKKKAFEIYNEIEG